MAIRRKKQRGQSLVEFALILPLLLLLLLGVIEASRVIWAYITVQTAAREAARYAVTGRPAVLSGTTENCTSPDNEEISGEPWICNPELRAKAIKEVAIRRGQTLNVSDICGDDSYDEYNLNTSDCGKKPGAFGVAVIGQLVDTGSLTATVQARSDYAGDQGLNVQVATYYNIEMIDPIFDTIMGGQYIQLTGAVQMQNEGLDQSLGFPPPPLPEADPDAEDPNLTTTDPLIFPNSDVYEERDNITINLNNHFIPQHYDIYLRNEADSTTQIINEDTCKNVLVENDALQFTCRMDESIGPGSYYLYSTRTGLNQQVAVYGSQTASFDDDAKLITIEESVTPRVEIEDGQQVWAAGSPVTVNLVNHRTEDETFDLYFQTDPASGIATEVPGAQDLSATDTIPWTVPNEGDACPPGGDTPCRLLTINASTGITAPYAIGDIYINQPLILLSGDVEKYRTGELMVILLTGHTPNHTYDVAIRSVDTAAEYPLETVTTDSSGNYVSIERFVEVGWATGDYEIVSYEPGTTNAIAVRDVQIEVPGDDPYITIDGGYTWPTGSFINIRLFNHEPNQEHYMEFGPWRVPTNNGSDTFTIEADGTDIVGYTIPLTAALGSEVDYDLISYLNVNDLEQANETVTVVPEPSIQVLEGDTVLPNSVITIRIDNHAPETAYRIYYGKTVGNENSVGKELLTQITNYNRTAQTTYYLTNLPAEPPPNFNRPDTCNCFGVFYEMYSESLIGETIAETLLAIDSADLAVTDIDFPDDVEINTTVPVTFTIQNLRPLTISRYFDIDLYLNPSPLVPAYREGQFNFPGDIKYWQRDVPPNGSFEITHDFDIRQYGEHELYGYADTTDFIRFEQSEGNNVDNNTLSVACVPPEITSGFVWDQKTFGPDTEGSGDPGSLTLTSDGRSTTGEDDDADDKGHLLMYLNETISTTAGIDVIVRVDEAPETANWAKGGIQIRNSVDDSRSMKIEYNLAWNGFNRHRIQLSYRNETAGEVINAKSQKQVNLNNNPVWLRIQREPGSDNFKFYYRQQVAKPTNWGLPYATAGIGMNDALYIGLFNSSRQNNQNGTSDFSNFSYTDTAACPRAAGPPEEDLPPGITLCTELLEDTSFEETPTQRWLLERGAAQGVSIIRAHSGRVRAVAPTFDSGRKNPYVSQQFVMPSWVVSSTTGFNITLWRNIDALADGNEPEDQFFAAVGTTNNPDSLATLVTTPTLVAQGEATFDWEFVSFNLDGKDGVNLEDYAGQNLYLHLYNNSNQNDNCAADDDGTCNTIYDFDDVQLTSCTTQPAPDNITTQLRGSVTLHRSGGSSENLSGVKVWTYPEAQDGDEQLYETFTGPDGRYNFYNLPPGDYFIYSEYHFIDAIDPTQIETLATNTIATLNENDVLTVNLDLYTID